MINRIFYCLSLLVWFFASVWSGVVVAYGLITAGNFSSFPDWAVYGFAFVLQATVSIGVYNVSSMYFPKKVLQVMVCIFVVVIIQSGELFHQIIAQVKNGQGSGLIAEHQDIIASFGSSINNLSNEIDSTVKSLYDGFRNEQAASRNGDDKTGIARCGKICRDSIDRANIVNRYLGYFSSSRSEEYVKSNFARDGLEIINSKINGLSHKLSQLKDLEDSLNESLNNSKDKTISVYKSANVSFNRIKNSINDYSKRIEGLGQAGGGELSMRVAFHVLKDLYSFNFREINEKSWLSIFYGLASLGCIIVASVSLSNLNDKRAFAEREVAELEKRVGLEKKIVELLGQLREYSFKKVLHEAYATIVSRMRGSST